MVAKPISIKGTGGKSGGWARKAVILLREIRCRSRKRDWGVKGFILKSAAGVSSGRSRSCSRQG